MKQLVLFVFVFVVNLDAGVVCIIASLALEGFVSHIYFSRQITPAVVAELSPVAREVLAQLQEAAYVTFELLI